jgi:hypothetical protein
MTNRSTARRRLVIALLLIPISLAAANAASEFTPKPTWQPVAPAAVKDQLEKYLATTGVDAKEQAAARQVWDADGQVDLLDRLAGALGKVDGRVEDLIDYCSGVGKPGKLPEFAWLADSETPLLVRHNMRVYFARWLVQQGYYDEALSWTDGLELGDVVAPDALLFYRAVAHQRLVQPDKAAADLAQLLEREDNIPTRYQKLGDLMRKDLAGLEDESLDHIARRMEDVRRRLSQGRSGEHVQGVENGVIESLDKLIKKAEEQMQKQAQCSAGQAGGQPSGTPMQDSRIAELKAPGRVEQRDIGRGAGWGNLPDKDREKALQDIGREFPSHYREVIEEYFRRLASEDSAGKP